MEEVRGSIPLSSTPPYQEPQVRSEAINSNLTSRVAGHSYDNALAETVIGLYKSEEASMGLAPQSAAKDASLRRRSGLSPAATSSAPATSGPTPGAANKAGAA